MKLTSFKEFVEESVSSKKWHSVSIDDHHYSKLDNYDSKLLSSLTPEERKRQRHVDMGKYGSGFQTFHFTDKNRAKDFHNRAMKSYNKYSQLWDKMSQPPRFFGEE